MRADPRRSWADSALPRPQGPGRKARARAYRRLSWVSRPTSERYSRAMKKTLALLAGLLVYVCANAQSFPTKPIRLVVSYPPGGGADLMARLVAPRMSEVLGQ